MSWWKLSVASLLVLVLVACGPSGPGGGSAGKPTIDSFSATPSSVEAGGQSTLSWSVVGATSLAIDQGVGAVSGSSVAVSPVATTTYTLTAANAAGSVTAQATVAVGEEGDSTSSYFLPYTFGGEVSNTSFPVVAVDAEGGVHVAYERLSEGFGGTEPAIYGYCPGACSDQSQFTTVAVGGSDSFIADLNLELDSLGRPRLLWSVHNGFRYAECNATCTQAESWTVSAPLSALAGTTDGSNRMFAIDSLDRPRFMFTDSDWGAHGGTYYMHCDAGCSQAANWSEVLISADLFTGTSLAIGAGDVVHFAFEAQGSETYFGYGRCTDASCSDWQGLTLYAVHGIYSDFALQLDADDNPRVALYSGPLEGESDLAANASYYLWCNIACTHPFDNDWDGSNLGLADDAYNALDFALDGQDRPRVAIKTENGMGLVWCENQCESDNGDWQINLLDSELALESNDLEPPDESCTYPGWGFGGSFFGYGISLALSEGGQPHIAYDAHHTWFCYGTSIVTDVTWARFTGVFGE